MEVYLGSIIPFGFSFAPQYFSQCLGQVIQITQNNALFAVLSTTYGGNGVQTFGLPDLRSRLPVGAGQGPGLSLREVGTFGGNEAVTLTLNNLPTHNHPAAFTPTGGGGSGSAISVTINACKVAPTVNPPNPPTPPLAAGAYSTAPNSSYNVLAASSGVGSFAANMWAPTGSLNTAANVVALDPQTATVTGGGGGITGGSVAVGNNGLSQPTGLMNPFLALNFCIAVQGLYPTRN